MGAQLFDTKLCLRCKGKGLCGRPCRVYSKIKDYLPKTKTHFSGSSPPEIFVGRHDYPNINAGILSPDSEEIVEERGLKISSTEQLSTPEIWHKNKFPIHQILTNRSKLIYGRFKTSIKQARINNKFISLMQEISMAYKSVSTEFFLKKAPTRRLEINKSLPFIGNPAPLDNARLQENPKVKPKVDYLVADIHAKSVDSITEMHKSNISVTNIMKILSAGLLGLQSNRKLVPTRWSITAVDDTISKNMLKRIKYYPEINDVLLFSANYNGNFYEILLLPDKFSFEVLEAEMKGSLWNPNLEVGVMQDYEFFNGRKKYAYEVTGAYYANRLALCEYLEKIKRQATAIFFREVRPEYYAPLGVGILRECCRGAFKQKPEKFNSVDQALKRIQEKFKLDVSVFTDKSVVLKEYGKQRRLSQYF